MGRYNKKRKEGKAESFAPDLFFIPNKKAVSTIEIIVSFTIFMAFLLFIFTYLNPIRENKNSLLDSLEIGIKTQAMVDLTELPVAVNKTNITGDCLYIPVSQNWTSNISVKSLEDKNINYTISSGNLYLNNIHDKLYRLIKSEEITIKNNQGTSPCQKVDPSQYTFSVERTERIYSYSKLISLNSSYQNADGYTGLKQKIDFPITSDFSIVIESKELNLSMTRKVPGNVQIRVRQYPIEILTSNADKIKAVMTLSVW